MLLDGVRPRACFSHRTRQASYESGAMAALRLGSTGPRLLLQYGIAMKQSYGKQK